MKHISFTAEAPYFTLNTLRQGTRRLWMACHGYGQLGKYFMRRFDVLDPETDMVIVPQGLSRFYLDQKYQRVGASWLTREHREIGIKNMHAYLNKVFHAETKDSDLSEIEICLFGFSQGTSAAARWGIQNQIPFRRLFVWAGTFPPEIRPEDVAYLDTDNVSITVFMGSEDAFFDADLFEKQLQHIRSLFPHTEVVRFEGGHEVRRDVLRQAVAALD